MLFFKRVLLKILLEPISFEDYFVFICFFCYYDLYRIIQLMLSMSQIFSNLFISGVL